MKRSLSVCMLIFLSANVFCQTPKEIIADVFKAQKSLKTVSYALTRTDTLVTGEVRNMHGQAKITTDATDTIFGFKFWSKKESDKAARIYDGHMGYELNADDKTYTLTVNPSDYFLANGGGQIILTDMIKLDTAKAVDFKIKQDNSFYYLTMVYTDLKEYDVLKRFKTLKINKQNMLPIAMTRHQETLGKVQDLYFEAGEMVVNDPASSYDFSSDDFLNEYKQRVIVETRHPVMSLKDKEAPAFTLQSFDNRGVSLTSMRGTVVLLDFWEVWCGPCIQSMPKVEQLYHTYKSEGLRVYGITNETKYLEQAKLLVKKKGVDIPMLVGNEQLKKDYKIFGIPLYILIDKTGKVVFVSEGYSDEMETAIKKAIL